MKHLKILANWRIATITILALVSVILLTGDTDGDTGRLFEFMVLKAFGLLFGYITYMLLKAWEGKMPLDIFGEL